MGDNMDKIILGLLLLKSRTIYEIRSRFAENLDLMYSSSMGSIQAALKKLLSLQYINYREYQDKGKHKKLYEITDAGRAAFYQWVNAPLQVGQNKNPELARLYFMGLSDKENRCARMEEYIRNLKEVHASLKLIYDEGETLTPPEEYAELFRFQFYTAKYGLDATAFEIEWFTKLMDELREEK